MSHKTCGSPVRLSATGAVFVGQGRLVGMLCNSSSSGTVTLYDALSATGTAFAAAIPLVAGAYTPLPIALGTGCWFVLGGTGDVTFLVN